MNNNNIKYAWLRGLEHVQVEYILLSPTDTVLTAKVTRESGRVELITPAQWFEDHMLRAWSSGPLED